MDYNSDFDDEEGEEEEVTINFKPSFVLIAIDTHMSMFETRKDEGAKETHPFKDALTACYELADSLILLNSRSNYNQFGVVLADEDDKASLVEVQNNLLDTIKLLKEKSEKSNEALKTSYGRNNSIDLAAFFRLCKKKFKDINANYYKRKLFFITNDDDPLKGDPQKKFAALNEAQTFEPSDITFELVTMREDFDYTKFYNELYHLYTTPPVTAEICQGKDGLVEKLSSSVVFRYRKLRYNFFPFKGDSSRFLKVMKVNFIREAKVFNNETVAQDGKSVIKIKENPEEANLEPPKFQVSLSTEERILLELTDKYDVYANSLPLGFHLQYVSDRISDIGVNIDLVSILIVDPKEELKYFDQFWQYCTKFHKVLICLKKYRNPSATRFVELIPKYANKQKLFLIKDVPFHDDINFPNEISIAKPLKSDTTESQRTAVKNFIDHLDFDYDPKMFINPSYAQNKAYLKSKLLGIPEETVEDATSENDSIDAQIKDHLAILVKEFKFNPLPQGQKRKPTTSRSGRGKK